MQNAFLLCAGGKASAWSEWLQPLLQQAVQAAPLEFSSLWACCVRFAVHSLSESGSDALGSLLDSISAPIEEGEHTQAISSGVSTSMTWILCALYSILPCKHGPPVCASMVLSCHNLL